MSQVAAFPLQWPGSWARAQHRQRAQFGTTGRSPYGNKQQLTVAEARQRLSDQLDSLGARYVTLSTNLELRLDGFPRSGQPEPHDPGAAVYFHLEGKPTVLACDKWDRTADNIAAIAKHIDALRGIERWGVGTAAQAFAGYHALPSPEQWWRALGVGQNATRADIIAAYRSKAREAHPDTGGSDAAMARLNAARDQGLARSDYSAEQGEGHSA
jgi:hypothetical protein